MRSELREKETIVLETRKHWLIVVKPVFVFLLSLMITFFVYAKGSAAYRDWQYISYLQNIMTFVTITSLLYILYTYWDYMTNMWIVTDLRILDEWGVFTRNLKETPLEKINNLSLRQSLLGRIFGFGDIEIQSAAEDGATFYAFVKSPDVLVHTISHVRDQNHKIKKKDSGDRALDMFNNPPHEQKPHYTCPYCGMALTGTEKIAEEKSLPLNKGV
jgi:uncharacterized membrane protein YdbT with pleckstrin-like domain